ncbi:group-specific protein [Bacillus sp. AK128]
MEGNQEVIHSGFEIEVNTPYSLNYLIYIQNIYLNSKLDDDERPKFPYIDFSMCGIVDEGFKMTFIEVWREAVNKNFQSGLYDHNAILKYDQALYQKLFSNNEKGEFGYSESVKSFLAWWDGIYGKIAIESVFDHDRMNKVYKELSTSIHANKRLKIDLLFDQPLITGRTEHSWYTVLPIEDIFIPKKRPEVISSLLKCCNIT